QAAIDALHDSALKDQVFGEVHLDGNRGNTEQRDAATEAQDVKSRFDTVGMSRHLKYNVHASSVSAFEDKLLHVAFAGIAYVVCLHCLCQLAPVLVHLKGEHL